MSPALSTAEHRTVQRASKAARNAGARRGRAALARAWAWVEAMGARVEPLATPSRVLYTVSVPGFHSQTAWRLADAVEVLDATVAAWCDGPATHGPTGARLDRLRALRAAWARALRAEAPVGRTLEAQDGRDTAEPGRNRSLPAGE